MTYQETLDWMFRQLPMYQNQGKSAYKKDLVNTILLANHLGNPEKNFKSVHVAGTNGKGSTSHMIASVLQEADYSVGLYTSPHLKDFRERIKINGKPVSKQFVIGFIRKYKAFFEENTLSFFEMTVGMAFDYFSKKKVDIAVIEVGLGGRLDSTNIVIPEVAVITNIGYDHQQFLGNTLQKIAKEKAGIFKNGIPVVIGETQQETRPVFDEIASKNESSITYADVDIKSELETDLKGSYQSNNTKTAISVLDVLNKKGWSIPDTKIKTGLLNVVKNTGLMGRWQIIHYKPKVICDVAHNKEGLTYTMQQLQKESYDDLHLVLGFVKDKDLTTIIDVFPKKAKYYLCKPSVQRGMAVKEVMDFLNSNGFNSKVFNSVKEAYIAALEASSQKDIVYVGGSTFVVADIL